MSGKKQHIIPRHIQNFFAIDDQIYVYKKEKHYMANIKDNYAERYYYSDMTDTTLDDKITDLESNKICPAWSNLNNIETNKEFDIINNTDIPIIIFHLALRNKEYMNALYENFIEKIDNLLNDCKKSENISFFIEKYYIENKIELDNDGISLEILKQILNHFKFFELYNTLSAQIIDSFEKNRKEIIKKLHFISVDDNFINSGFEKFKNYKYKIIETDEDVVLSDSLILFKDSKNEYSFFQTEPTLCILPISRKKILFVYNDYFKQEYIDIKNININLIKNSCNSYISSNKNDEFINLRSLINQRNNSFDNIDLDENFFYEQLKKGFDDILVLWNTFKIVKNIL